MLAPFSKKPLNLTLAGVTTDEKDLSVRLLFLFFDTELTPYPRLISCELLLFLTSSHSVSPTVSNFE